MSALELMSRLRKAGIRVSVNEGKIRIKAEKGALTESLRNDIATHKAAILALLVQQSGDEPTLSIVSREQPLPLSYAQQRLWFLDELEPGTPIYNMPFALTVHGELDRTALQSALDKLIVRHETLRTVFPSIDDTASQVVLPSLQLKVQWESIDDPAPEALTQRSQEVATQGFDLSKGPLLRLHVLSTAAQEHLVVLVIHHIISDLWSMDVFFRDLGLLYEPGTALNNATPDVLPFQYVDYAAWQRELVSGSRLQGHLDYWCNQLRDAPPVLEVPVDYARPAEPGYHGHWHAITLPASLTRHIGELTSQSEVTLFMLTMTAFAVLLSKYANESDLVIGTPISGRHRTELEGLIGFFLNTLALRIDTSGNPRFNELLQKVKNIALDAYAHQELPFERLVEELQPERDMSHTPVFQHMFICQDSRNSKLTLPGLRTEPAKLISHDTAKFDLTLAVTQRDDGIEVGVEYSTELFRPDTIERMLAQYQSLLEIVCQQPDTPLKALTLLPDDEREMILRQFNATATDFGEAVCVHELVERQTNLTPEHIALCFNNTQLTYRELNERANVLASKLRELGISRGAIAAISCERSLELPVAALAVLKSGACYLPVDPNYPQERISAMLEDSGAAIVLTQSGISLPAHDAQVLLLDQTDFDGTPGNLENLAAPSDPLYCIYTSGSTGTPKGVQLSHAGLANLLRWQIAHERLGKAARTLQFASFSFDVSFQELFSTWATGGCLVMVEEELRQDLNALAKFIAAEQIQRLYLPFAAFQPIAETLVAIGSQPALQDVIVAGEQLQVSPEVSSLFATLNDAALHNQYGPSETHVVTALTLTGDADTWPALPSIGTPVANTRCYVLDENLQPTPVGIPGELYLGGIQVAIAYLGRPELNQEKFLDSPFDPTDRLYRTGDKVRWLDSGELQFLGRCDEQFKFRGFRIEPGEIETALSGNETVNQAVVSLHTGAQGVQRLVAYVTSAGEQQPDPQALRILLRDQLPEYMVPSAIVVLEVMPLTPSGKIARRLLPEPELSDADNRAYVAPQTPTQEILTRIWSDVLGIERVGIHDDFFALGGHSLLATKVISRIRDQFSTGLPLKYLFRYPSPEALAAAIKTLQEVRTVTPDAPNGDRDEFRI